MKIGFLLLLMMAALVALGLAIPTTSATAAIQGGGVTTVTLKDGPDVVKEDGPGGSQVLKYEFNVQPPLGARQIGSVSTVTWECVDANGNLCGSSTTLASSCVIAGGLGGDHGDLTLDYSKSSCKPDCPPGCSAVITVAFRVVTLGGGGGTNLSVTVPGPKPVRPKASVPVADPNVPGLWRFTVTAEDAGLEESAGATGTTVGSTLVSVNGVIAVTLSGAEFDSAGTTTAYLMMVDGRAEGWLLHPNETVTITAAGVPGLIDDSVGVYAVTYQLR